jgi:hypothetical protein
MDFTLDRYAQLCTALVEAGYIGMGMAAYLTSPPENTLGRVVLLRHDVDSHPTYSLKMAQVEHQHGLTATYFYRTVGSLLRPEIVKAVSILGHEIGYHYETLAQSRGNLDQAVQLFGEELARLRQYAPVRVASMHGSPLRPWDNRDIWNRVSPADFGLAGEVYRDLDYRVIHPRSPGHNTGYHSRNNQRLNRSHRITTSDASVFANTSRTMDKYHTDMDAASRS